MLPLSRIHTKRYIDDLEKIQHRAAKLNNISRFSNLDHQAALNSLSLLYHHMQRNTIETSKILNHIYDNNAPNFQTKCIFLMAMGCNLTLFAQHANFNVNDWFFPQAL